MKQNHRSVFAELVELENELLALQSKIVELQSRIHALKGVAG